MDDPDAPDDGEGPPGTSTPDDSSPETADPAETSSETADSPEESAAAGDADSGGIGDLSRRKLLAGVGGVAVLGGGAAAMFGGETSVPNPSDIVRPDPETARDFADAFAPTLYFGAGERWFPTDPRRYESQQDGETVVRGFDALDGYTKEFEQSGDPPAPTVFYNVVEVTDRLTVVQHWFYSAFDQFTTNFHWHDWELLQTFVDTETNTPKLYCASAHSRKVPNNEFLDPKVGDRVAIVSEVGSHSSALGVNASPRTFQRFPSEDTFADITNRAIDVAESVASVPAAYGLPRDEGVSLPYVVPELDGAPIYEHDRLPNVEQRHLVPADLTVRSFSDLSRPPEDLPRREQGLSFGPAGTETDATYDLVPMQETDHITEYTGPQLSFEFAVPEFAEDAISGHITTVGKPQDQPRYRNPLDDVTDPRHRSALAEQFDGVETGGPVSQVVGVLRQATAGAPGAPEGGGISLSEPTTEQVALLESEPAAIPTTNGIVFATDVEEGEHRLTVNGPGVAPYTQRLQHTSGETPTRVGVEGEMTVVPNREAVKVRADARETPAGVANLQVADDFAGPVYDALPAQDDTFGVYVHRSGAYTAEITDRDGDVGAFRVNPDPDDDEVTIENPMTGKLAMTRYLVDYLSESLAEAESYRDRDDTDDEDIDPLVAELETAVTAARRARDAAEADDASAADERLAEVGDRVDAIAEAVRERRDELSPQVLALLGRRIERARERVEEAIDAPLK
jgi:hypothetical protein